MSLLCSNVFAMTKQQASGVETLLKSKMTCTMENKDKGKKKQYYLCKNDSVICYFYNPFTLDQMFCMGMLEILAIESQM